ncbi:hypothetical protein D3C75_827720 [compost metagenome]
MDETATGYRVFRPIMGNLGVVPFELTFVGTLGELPTAPMHPEIWDYIGTIPGEAGRAVARMVTRMIKHGVVFDKVERVIVKDYRSIVLQGYAYRNAETHTAVKLTIQEIAVQDDELVKYHEYFTE